MTGTPTSPIGRNIIIFSDGTGQRGGVYFDEARTNIYKLYRAARSGPDSNVPPERQLAYYDPGLGTQPESGGSLLRAWRAFYNLVSQATGLGITHNIIDCYTAIIQLWRPGDRIFLFGFSRGAYTVRCLATALCYSGIPTQTAPGVPLKRNEASARKLATTAVKSVYQHVSSPRDAQFFEQRRALAQQYRTRHACTDTSDTFPFFIGVFDTVAALSNYGSLAILAALYGVVLLAASLTLGYFSAENTIYWAAWLVFDTVCLAGAAYVFTHLKFSFSLPGFHWWETIHLTTFRQKFYDQALDPRVGYARHAISIDERRADFKRVKWGEGRRIERPAMERLEQFWFAGNHADIGGGYLENESRLSDIALGWMVAAASDSLGERGLILDRAVLTMHPAADGIQHDETRSLAFRLAGKSDRAPVPEATLHPTVVERFGMPGVLQYDVMSLYRPEALRGHTNLPGAYDNIPMPRQTCLQLMKASYKAWRRAHRKEHPWRDRFFLFLKGIHMDRVVSCLALLFLVVAAATGILIFGYQLVEWLRTDIWHPLPLEVAIGGIRNFGSGWLGLQRVYDWILALPLSILFIVIGFLTFWAGGLLSAYLYKRAARVEAKPITPSQSHA
ncbi:T6SS phospholipase effector Tle1-like catalytic domain-containing protein [Bradyrhizobium sp. McL0615]|uniref:T6SS phospholipase effector Tle1-like catalytic domain-containing protein n=1 Tax=Bradyrhizobium sp. McL0615 TaxID=3415673 RepID=UPI003CED4515